MRRTASLLKKRIVSLLALISILMSLIPHTALPASADISSEGVSGGAYIAKDGQPVSELVLEEDEKITLTAVCNQLSSPAYQWEIKDKDYTDRWIKISGAFSSTLSVTYALVNSMTDENGDSYLRCRFDKNGQYVTEPVRVRVSYSTLDQYPYLVDGGVVNTESDPDEMITTAPIGSWLAAKKYYADGNDDYKTCSIVINYLFDNNAIAFEPYGASVAYGSDFSEVVNSPAVVGYAPFRRVGDNYVDASVVELNYTNITSDITINVIYEPALVEFQVHHHLQNLMDDDYSVHYDLITKSQALTGTVVPDGLALTEEQLPGFKALAYEKLTVAADGSTVVEIRYDRNYYLVDFDAAGGYGSEPVYTRYGMSVGTNTPVKHGYVFGGWELISYGGNPPTNQQIADFKLENHGTITVPAANLRYKAIWTAEQTEYTMVFWKENANDNGYSYWGYLDGLKAMSGTYVDAQNLVGDVAGIDDEAYFTFNPERSDKNVLVEGDGSTVVNVYYTRNYYSLTFKGTGKCTIPVNHNHTIECYDEICGKGHVHDDSCIRYLECVIPEHTAHTAECLFCGKAAHTHGSADCACTLDEHEHTKDCWTNVGNAYNGRPQNAPTNAVNGQVYRRNSFLSSTYYIYIKGTWYVYNSRASNGTIVDTACGFDSEHEHGIDCECDVEQHTHIDSCYRDVIHTHSEDCYTYMCDGGTHTHNDNCYRLICPITERHSHSNNCNSSTKTNTVKRVYRKYQQSMEDLWPVVDLNGVTYDSGERWSPSDSSYYDNVLVYISTMPPDDFTLTLNEADYSTYVMNYHLQVLPGEEYDGSFSGNQYELHNVVKANYNYVTRAEDFFDIRGFYQFGSDPAFSNNQIKISGNDKTVDFYYNRITDHWLEFNNNGILIDDKSVYGIMYGAKIKDYNFVPDYPSNLEPNAYAFAGWYTSPGCFDGTEVNWDTVTMPEGDFLLYAKWAPVKHVVRVYKDATLTEQIGEEQYVEHNSFVSAPVDHISNGNYIFQGWFYMDNVDGQLVEKAFVFSGIPVIEDMNIYAKWSSHTSVEYKINYLLWDTKEPVADVTLGTAIAGHNKTFEAKAGNDLYSQFRTGYFPLTNSHTITMSVDGTHEFTFYYVYVEAMPYLVRYVDAATGESVLPDKYVYDNMLSVVTETFVRVDGMMPDAYQKRLVLSASNVDSDEDGVFDANVITFNYNSDSEHAYYRVTHFIQNITGDGFREYRSVETVGSIGTEYTVDSLTLTGFVFDGSRTVINGEAVPTGTSSVTYELGSEGMLIELYYVRLDYNYVVKYTNAETGKDVLAPKNAKGIFGSQVLEYAPDLTTWGYTLASDDLKILTISANEDINVVEFKYQESIVSIKYQIVGEEDGGSLSRYSENLKAISGISGGSHPIVSEGYLFVGWYTDVDCKIPVDEDLVNYEDKHLTPVLASGEIWKETVYYAKIVKKVSDLTIITTSTQDADQSFLFCVEGVDGTDTADIKVFVSIKGDGKAKICELPLGDYTVTEMTDWSWRYGKANARREVQLSFEAEENVVQYDNVRENGRWLDGNSRSENVY